MAEAAGAHSASIAQTRSTSWSLPQLTFTQGLLIGQLSIILVVVALIRYLLFEDAAPQPLDDEDEEPSQSGKVRRLTGLTARLFFSLTFISFRSRLGFTTSLPRLISAKNLLSPVTPLPFALFSA